MPFSQQWTLTAALRPFLSQTITITYALYILAYPPHRRYPAFLPLFTMVLYTFIHHLSLTPWYSLNDTFGRMLYIWLAHMSYAYLLVRITLSSEQRSGWRERLRWAGKVMYTRHLGEYVVPTLQAPLSEGEKAKRLEGLPMVQLKRRREPFHRLARFDFCVHHLVKAALFLALNHAVDTYIHPPTLYPPASFVRRVPSSLSVNELKLRLLMTWDVCIADMLYLESVYSVFAILWVGIFRLDSASEWSRSLFGPLSDAYSVRRYWGVYWHDFINASFTGHVKVATRGCLGLPRGSIVTRFVENALVFLVSGLLHSLIHFVQTEGNGEIWTVTIWYGAQMLPIVVEGVAHHLWYNSGLREQSLALVGERMLLKVERMFGFAWVLSWMFWSVPKYLLTRHARELDNMRRKYPEFLLCG